MEAYGRIIAVLPEASGTSARGNQWRKATYVLETQEQYPKKIVFDVLNDKIDQLGIHQGEVMTVRFDIDAREHNERWYNSVIAWSVVRQQQNGQQAGYGGGYQQQQSRPQQQWGTNNPSAGAQAIPQAAQQAMRAAAPPQAQGGDEGLPF